MARRNGHAEAGRIGRRHVIEPATRTQTRITGGRPPRRRRRSLRLPDGRGSPVVHEARRFHVHRDGHEAARPSRIRRRHAGCVPHARSRSGAARCWSMATPPTTRTGTPCGSPAANTRTAEGAKHRPHSAPPPVGAGEGRRARRVRGRAQAVDEIIRRPTGEDYFGPSNRLERERGTAVWRRVPNPPSFFYLCGLDTRSRSGGTKSTFTLTWGSAGLSSVTVTRRGARRPSVARAVPLLNRTRRRPVLRAVSRPPSHGGRPCRCRGTVAGRPSAPPS